MQDKICHEGIVDHVQGEQVFVRILSHSACESCHSKSMCSVSEMKEKLIEARNASKTALHPGDQVLLEMKRSMGNKAVFLGYLLPFVLLMITLIIAGSLTGEGVTGLLSVLVLCIYYLLLFAFRNRLQRVFYFEVRQKHNPAAGG